MCEGIAGELLGMDLGDERLNRRSVKILEALAADPQASANGACAGAGVGTSTLTVVTSTTLGQSPNAEFRRPLSPESFSSPLEVGVARSTTGVPAHRDRRLAPCRSLDLVRQRIFRAELLKQLCSDRTD